MIIYKFHGSWHFLFATIGCCDYYYFRKHTFITQILRSNKFSVCHFQKFGFIMKRISTSNRRQLLLFILLGKVKTIDGVVC